MVTHGLRWYMLPELELRLDPGADPAPAARELATVGLSCLRHGQPRAGLRIGPDGRSQTHELAAGRVGPAPGTSYGRWGSLAVTRRNT